MRLRKKTFKGGMVLISKKMTQNQSQKDKTEHENGKKREREVKKSKASQRVKFKQSQVKVTPGSGLERALKTNSWNLKLPKVALPLPPLLELVDLIVSPALSKGVLLAVCCWQEAVDILKLAIVDHPRDITDANTLQKGFLTQDFIGPRFTKMAHDVVTRCDTCPSVRKNFAALIEMLKIPSKFAKSLTCGASISWGSSRLHEGTNIYSWRSTYLANGEAKRSPTNDASELFANS
ncbi:hypothetical protein Tco_0828790 [Tanacetum coccineum]